MKIFVLISLLIGNGALAAEIVLSDTQSFGSGQFFVSAASDAACKASLADLKAKLDKANIFYTVEQITWATVGNVCWEVNVVK